MELPIPNGKSGPPCFLGPRWMKRAFSLLALAALGIVPAMAQVPVCNVYSVANNVHAEGITERLGDLRVTCTGSPGGSVSLNIFVGLNVNITNKVDTNGNLDAIVSVDTGGGFTPLPVNVQLSNAQSVSLLGIRFTMPPNGTAAVRLSNLRGSIASLVGNGGIQAVLANVAGTGATFNISPVLALSTPTTSIYASFLNNGVPCIGNPIPATFDLPGLNTASNYASALRVSEGFGNSFAAARPGDTNGTRIIVKISGYPSGARVFVPDALVGNSGSNATTVNAFGYTVQLGIYTPGGDAAQLLLTRVDGADANGAGGTGVIPLPNQETTFSSAYEVKLVNGAATIVYEVLDANANARESVQVPLFVVTSPTSCPSTSVIAAAASIGPVSTIVTSSATAPTPRFFANIAASDCTIAGDCTSYYFPKLEVNTNPVNIAGAAFGATQNGYVRITNSGPGLVYFTGSVSYPSGSAAGWLTISPASGVNNTSITATANPAALSPGVYNATVTVNGGSFGSFDVPIIFTVGAPGVTIQSIVSAATFTQGAPLTAGGIGALYGLNLTGTTVSLNFDGLPAVVFGTYPVTGTPGQVQINFQVPALLTGRTTAGATMIVDGIASNKFPITLAQNTPGVFNPGILNQTNSVNLQGAPAKVGTIVAAYMTGLTLPLTGQVTVKIGTLDFLIPQYAGQAPTLTGVEQINILIPSSLTFTGNSVPFVVCIPALDPTQRVCSPAVNLYVTP